MAHFPAHVGTNDPPDCISIASMANKANSKKAAEISNPRSCGADALSDGEGKSEEKKRSPSGRVAVKEDWSTTAINLSLGKSV